ncbi:hypothetical protein ACHAWF_002569 [Thalassiosira exigua]
MLLTILAAASITACSAWVSPNDPPLRPETYAVRQTPSAAGGDRRRFLARLVGSAATIPILAPSPAAAASSQQQKDKDNIVKGYNRLQYLLDNWEAETTVCKTGQEEKIRQTTFGDKCERTPTKVMEYLGFKSTNDPLFKADATMMRLKDAVPGDREVDFYDAVDAFAQNADEANSMAFVSSWGEANPGGGKDRVKLFIERSKNNVIVSRDSLKTVMDIFDLSP